MSKLSGIGPKLIASPLGGLIVRPWLDTYILYFLKNWFFPLSRLWAAARQADGNVDAFIIAVPLHEPNDRQRKTIAKTLLQFEHARLKALSIDQLWREYFFSSKAVAEEQLPIIEEMRLDYRSAYNLTRKQFVSLRKLVKTSVAMDPPTPEDVRTRFGTNGEKLEQLLMPPVELPEIRVSHKLPTAYGCDYWLRFESPYAVMGDEVFARVHEPEDVRNPPTLIFGHGICVEFDHYHQLIDEITQLTSQGIRVIRPEAPWHGRRVLPGHYGGEQFLSRLPASIFDFIVAQNQEWASLINWCRSNSDAAVAVGGSSLGAQTAKTVAMNARHWPKKLQPDALLAITHSQHIAAALDGALADIWNLGKAMREAGWNQELERQWVKLLDPEQSTCMSGENIISVCGSEDIVTPIVTANKQLDAWAVPANNRFVYRRGHFTVPLGMIYDNEPLQRFAQVLKRHV